MSTDLLREAAALIRQRAATVNNACCDTCVYSDPVPGQVEAISVARAYLGCDA